jgi:hypothetical protein
MKRVALLSGALLLLSGAYGMWRRQRRSLEQAREQDLDLQAWETEGGSPANAIFLPPPGLVTAARRERGRC